MKKLLYLYTLLFLLPTILFAQEPFTTIKNSVEIIVPLAKVSNVSSLNSNNSIRIIQYTDGLGQSNVSVIKNITPLGKDIVSLTSFGCEGSIVNNWLPVPITQGNSLPDPAIVMQSAKTFYGDSKPYSSSKSEKLFGGFFIQQITPPGQDWHNNDKKKTMKSYVNYDEDYSLYRVTKYTVTSNGVKNEGYYPTLMLKLIENTDEDGKKIIDFFDFTGNHILQRKVVGNTDVSSFDTYYVYDDMNNLCYVLPPEASNRMRSVNSVYACVANNPIEQCAYIYRYDGEKRCIEQKNPGADWVYYVYDQSGRLALSQDGNQRETNTWIFQKYDKYGRPIQNGSVVLTQSLSNIRDYIKSRVMTETWTNSGYSDSFTLGTNKKVYTTYYYDNYNFLNLSAYASIKQHLLYTDESDFDARCSRMSDGMDIAMRGMPTGTSVSLMNDTGVIVAAVYYDDKNRVVQSHSTNHLNGYDKYYLSYDFTGNVLKQRHIHKAFSNAEIIENYIYEYDNKGRFIATNHAINDLPVAKINAFQYDELGRINKKFLHFNKHNIIYTYNIHGKLKTSSNVFYSQTIRYQDGNLQKYYNGNISEIDEINCTISANDGSLSHSYQYDEVNRLSFNKSSLQNHASAYNGQYAYDRNGNITTIIRNGFVRDISIGSAPIVIDYVDRLNIYYRGNQISKIYDYEYENNPPIGNTDFRYRSGGGSTEFMMPMVTSEAITIRILHGLNIIT